MEGRTLPSSAVTRNGARQGTESWGSRFTRYENYQGYWMEQMRGSLMLVATVIATMTFQIAINPPGGVWQADTDSKGGCALDQKCKAGTSVLAFGDSSQKFNYEIFILLCTVSFSASQTIILLLICGFSLSNRVVMWVLIIAMGISLYCTAGAYFISIRMVMHPFDQTASRAAVGYGLYWAGLFVLLCLVLFCRLLFWLLKRFCSFLFWVLKKCLCCCTSSHSH